jgi:hypothetical protein
MENKRLSDKALLRRYRRLMRVLDGRQGRTGLNWYTNKIRSVADEIRRRRLSWY